MDKGIIVAIIFILGSVGGGVFLLQLSDDDVDETKFFAVDSPPPQPIVEQEEEPDDARGLQRVVVPEGEEVLIDEEERIKQEIEEAEQREREVEDAARAADLEERNRIAREEAIEEARENAEREIREREEQEAAERENVRAKEVEGIEARAREQSVCNSECLEKRERDAFVNGCLDEWTPSCDTLVPQAKDSGFVVSNVELKITEFDLHDTLCVGLLESRARNTQTPEVLCGYSDPSVVIIAGEYFMYVNRFDYIDKEDALLLYTSINGINWELKSDPLDAVIFADVTMAMARVTEDGGVRIYYTIPEGNENEGWIASAYSANGIDGWVFEGALFESIDESNIYGPEVVELDDNSFVMYFSKDIIMHEDLSAETILTKITSAISVDEKIWNLDEDSSIVFSDDYEGMNKFIEGGDSIYGKALNPGVVRLDDGRYLMVYTASATHFVCGNFNCNTFVPRVTDELWAATSEDGVVWKKIGSLGLRGSDATIVALGNNQFRVYADDVDTTKGINTSEIENHWVGTFIITVE